MKRFSTSTVNPRTPPPKVKFAGFFTESQKPVANQKEPTDRQQITPPGQAARRTSCEWINEEPDWAPSLDDWKKNRRDRRPPPLPLAPAPPLRAYRIPPPSPHAAKLLSPKLSNAIRSPVWNSARSPFQWPISANSPAKKAPPQRPPRKRDALLPAGVTLKTSTLTVQLTGNQARAKEIPKIPAGPPNWSKIPSKENAQDFSSGDKVVGRPEYPLIYPSLESAKMRSDRSLVFTFPPSGSDVSVDPPFSRPNLAPGISATVVTPLRKSTPIVSTSSRKDKPKLTLQSASRRFRPISSQYSRSPTLPLRNPISVRSTNHTTVSRTAVEKIKLPEVDFAKVREAAVREALAVLSSCSTRDVQTEVNSYAVKPLVPSAPPLTPALFLAPKNSTLLHDYIEDLCCQCGREIGQEPAMNIHGLKLFFHVACFRCTDCEQILGSGRISCNVMVRHRKLHCRACYYRDD